MSEIQVGISLPQLNHDLAQIFENGQETSVDVRIPGPRQPSDEAVSRNHLHLAPAVPEVVLEPVADSLAVSRQLRQSPWFTDLPVALVASLVVAAAAQMPTHYAVGVLITWAISALYAGKRLNAPGATAFRGLAPAISPPIAAAGLAVAVTGDPTLVIGKAALIVFVASLSLVILRSLRVTTPLRTVVVGDGASIAEAASRWHGDAHIKVVGACSSESASEGSMPGQFEGMPWVHGQKLLGSLVDDTRADLVLMAPGVSPEQLRHASWELEGRSARLALLGPLDAVAPHRVSTTSFAGSTLVHIAPSRPAEVVQVVKGALDRVFGAALLLAAAPVLLMLMALIRLDSPGAALFRQTRVGINGRPFTIFKLRTMSVDAEALRAALLADNEVDGNLFKIKADPRVTKIGKFLRRASLDELPQLLNVVRGEMSIIGPRPALPEEVAAYDTATSRRLAVKPGITGLWQVSGRSDLPYDEAVRLDLHYADNWRISDDAVIVLRTAHAVVASRGAY
ncbi:Undecaprenyl-phosphate galactose phosphotransferase (modular protein) [metagenome]|uniref:Undecaprenyl-phosphate galactose phosphotransferase (Modular protein) n=1 Tax=metagenome TaxID=256318 RepID=A0A2P2BZD0_9ZZZZ